MVPRPLGRSALEVSPIGLGAFKIGRNAGIKYAQGYAIPGDDAVTALLHGAIDLGITYFDTAPAYGLSEERLGNAMAGVEGIVISTKVGETFEHGRSTYDFGAAAVRRSVERSRVRLRRDVIDLVFVHSSGDDLSVIGSGVVETLQALRQAGVVRALGFSGKSVEGARAALAWADAIMVEYHLDDQTHAPVIAEARDSGVGVIVKKGLASGRLDPAESIRFVLGTPGVGSLLIGSLNLEHLRANVAVAEHIAP
jgi:aryl-alcohol dehydrogenase-like predicted oxidoreductase